MSPATELIDVLKAQIGCAQAMLDALDRERAALLDPTHANLDDARADKDRLIATLEALEQRRRALTAAAGQQAHPAGGTEWNSLLELVAACRDHNRRNGALLGVRRQAIAAVLRRLRGGGAPEPYGRDGREPRPGGGRPLGSA